jgi:hypothetical protein
MLLWHECFSQHICPVEFRRNVSNPYLPQLDTLLDSAKLDVDVLHVSFSTALVLSRYNRRFVIFVLKYTGLRRALILYTIYHVSPFQEKERDCGKRKEFFVEY